MADWLVLIVILLFALVLLLVEIIFIPGTTWFGLAGVVLAIIGVYISFRQLGNTAGWLITGSFAVVWAAALYYGFRANIWRRFALNQQIESRVNDETRLFLRTGDTGRTVSALRPMGKAEFAGQWLEVQTLGGFLDENIAIEVVKTEGTKIFVKPQAT
jgi:membrane-bound ClpP family serine protease